jgi:Flp pilus assembly protein TadD
LKPRTLTGAVAAALLSLSLAGTALAIDSGGGGGGGGGGSSSSSSSSSSTASRSAPTLEDARARIDQGRCTAALRILNQLVEAQPNDADINNLVGYCLREKGRYAQAEQFYLKALQIDPNHLGANEYLGELYAKTGHLDQARQRLAVLKQLCGNCEAYEDLAEAIEDAS